MSVQLFGGEGEVHGQFSFLLLPFSLPLFCLVFRGVRLPFPTLFRWNLTPTPLQVCKCSWDEWIECTHWLSIETPLLCSPQRNILSIIRCLVFCPTFSFFSFFLRVRLCHYVLGIFVVRAGFISWLMSLCGFF